MKLLIFPLILFSVMAYSADEEILGDSELKNKLISVVKEVQIEQTLGQSQEIKNCKAKSKFDPKNKVSVDAAVKCFQEELAKQKDPKALEKLSDSLGLQSYGLVPSKDKKEITKYLSDRMYESLTGIDRDEKDLKTLMEQMKFKNKKQVDQKVFFELYRTQLIKNSLFEVSRYCFENFRNKRNEEKNGSFIEHWGDELQNLQANDDITNYTDVASKGFGDKIDTSSKDKIYQTLLEGLGINNPNNVTMIQNFFMACASKIVPLCKKFEESKTGKGANSCLTKAKIQNSKKALAKIKLLADDFDSLNVAELKIELDGVIHYESKGKDSIDNLTNYSSADILDAKVVEDNRTKNCADDPSGADCEAFIVVDDSRDKIAHEMDLDLRLKSEAEKARVRALKEEGGQKLEEYLEANGYFDLLKAYNADKTFDLEGEIAKVFDARREAALAELHKKVGSRQMSETEATAEYRSKSIKDNAQASQEEQARLAQVVMFNNIITGFLSLEKETEGGKRESVGQNISVLQKETAGLEAAKIEGSYFQNLKTSVEGKTGNVDNASFEGVGILDTILGKDD